MLLGAHLRKLHGASHVAGDRLAEARDSCTPAFTLRVNYDWGSHLNRCIQNVGKARNFLFKRFMSRAINKFAFVDLVTPKFRYSTLNQAFFIMVFENLRRTIS